MTWTTFFAAADDFVQLTEAMLQFEGARLFEVYSRLGHRARSVATPAEAVATFCLGDDPSGKGIAAHCALWVPSVMAPPTQKRIDLTTGDWRETVEGCGLFWLQAGGVHENTITESRLGWFSEAGARQKCHAEPGADAVNWSEHATVAATLKKALATLRAARAKRFPVLGRAARLHAQGFRLLHGMGIKEEISVDAV